MLAAFAQLEVAHDAAEEGRLDVAEKLRADHMTFVGWPKVRKQLLELHGVR